MKKLFAALLAAAVISVTAAEEWIRIANNDEYVYEIKRASVEASQTDKGTKVYMAIGRVIAVDTKKISGAIWYVSIDHCRLQRGKFVVLDVSGEYKSDHDFIFGLGTIASTLAETICLAAAPKNKSNSSPMI